VCGVCVCVRACVCVCVCVLQMNTFKVLGPDYLLLTYVHTVSLGLRSVDGGNVTIFTSCHFSSRLG
jgi:hypothetical protein